MGKKFEIKDGDISDGYHTFDELYEHRCLLFINLVLAFPEYSYWRPHYEGWPLIGIDLPGVGQITYHVPEKLLPLLRGTIKEGGPAFDGHTSHVIVDRLKVLTDWMTS